jgi:hypothetical protein
MVDPLNQVPGPPGSGQCLTNRRKVRTDRAVRAAKKDPEAFVEHAACALAGHVVASGSPAGGAVGVEVQPAARAADQRLSLAGDQDPEQPALGAFGRGVEDGAVAVLANRTRGPSGVHRFDVVTAAAPVAGAGSARVPNPAAVGAAAAGPLPAAERADLLRAEVAVVAEIWACVGGALGDGPHLATASADAPGSLPAIARLTDRAVGLDDRGGPVLAADAAPM